MLKQLLLVFTTLLFNSTSFAQNEQTYYDYKNVVILKTMAKVGASTVFFLKVPICSKDPEQPCFDFFQKVLFNCSTNQIFYTGHSYLSANGDPQLLDYFEESAELNAIIPKLKSSCSKKPEHKRIYLWVAQNNSLEGYFLISDTLKKEKNIVTAWIETRQFEKILNNNFKYLSQDYIKYLIYSTFLKNDSEYSKINWKFNCKEQTSAAISSIYYDSEGKVKKSNQNQEIFYPVVPDSVGESVLTNVCSML